MEIKKGEDSLNRIQEWDYEAMMEVAGKLRELSNSSVTGELASDIQRLLDELSWSGAAAKSYKERAGEIITSLKKDDASDPSESIKLLANLLEENVKKMQEADPEIAEKVGSILDHE